MSRPYRAAYDEDGKLDQVSLASKTGRAAVEGSVWSEFPPAAAAVLAGGGQ